MIIVLLMTYSFHHFTDRTHDRYWGVIVYIKNNLSYIRRSDLEPNGLECIWIQLMISNKKQILCGAFYRPPNSHAAYTSLKEDLIGVATDTNISDVIITGDFHFNQLIPTYFNII